MKAEIIGLTELRQAIKQNPQNVLNEVGIFLARGIAVYNRGIMRSPWTMGSNGGGAPVSTGNLRDSHLKTIERWQAKIAPEAKYAPYVHGLNGKDTNARGVQLRPWLDYVQQTSAREIEELQKTLLDKITAGLAK